MPIEKIQDRTKQLIKRSLGRVRFTEFCANSRVPTRTGKPGKMGRHFPVREKSGNFDQTEKSGKITQNTGKLREFQTKIMLFFSDC